MSRTKQPKTAWIWVAVLGICAIGAGCTQPLNVRGDGFKDDGFSNVNRPVDHTNALYGFSTKAQEIEKNLGVR